MRRSYLIIAVLTLSLSIIVTSTRASGWTAEETILDLSGESHFVYLAPDGSRFARLEPDGLCLYSLAGEKQSCVSLKDHHLNEYYPETVRWSPDSTKIAFSEDHFLTTFRDSDIWVFDTTTNTLTDITPAPNRDVIIIKNPDLIFTVDLSPQWSADSQSVYFIRYVFHKLNEARAEFFRVKVAGGEAEKVGSAVTDIFFSTYGFALAPDESHIAYDLVDAHGLKPDEKVGTWLMEVGTGATQFAMTPIEQTVPYYYQFSPDGSQVLSIGQDLGGESGTRPFTPETSPIYTLPVTGGDLHSLSTDNYVTSAGWGLEGKTLVYTTSNSRNSDPSDGVYITDASGENAQQVLQGKFFSPTLLGRSPLIWAANNTLLLGQNVDGKAKVVLVQLKQT